MFARLLCGERVENSMNSIVRFNRKQLIAVFVRLSSFFRARHVRHDRTMIIIIIVIFVVVGRTIEIVNERVGYGRGISSISGVCVCVVLSVVCR